MRGEEIIGLIRHRDTSRHSVDTGLYVGVFGNEIDDSQRKEQICSSPNPVPLSTERLIINLVVEHSTHDDKGSDTKSPVPATQPLSTSDFGVARF